MKYLHQIKTRNQIFFIIICFLTISPFFIAKYIYDHQELINKTRTVSRGNLIPQNNIFDISALNLKDSGYASESTANWINKKWHILYFPSNNKINSESIDLLQNVNIALGKEESRAQRTVIFSDDFKLDDNTIPKTQKFLNLRKISKVGKSNLYKKFNINLCQDTVWIADPMGNVMMYYKPPFDQHKFKDILVDLRKLLSISIIG